MSNKTSDATASDAPRKKKPPRCATLLPGGQYLVPYGGTDVRRFRLYSRLDVGWALLGLMPLCCIGGAAIANPFVVSEYPQLVNVILSFSGATLVAEVLLRALWKRSVFRILAHYYRGWLEPSDSPRFAAYALVLDWFARWTLLATFALVWSGCLAVAGGFALVRAGEAFAGYALVLAGFLVVIFAGAICSYPNSTPHTPVNGPDAGAES